jgi:hypothetical protein
MHEGRLVFAQLMDLVPRQAFGRCVERYQGNYHVRNFSCWDQFLCMAFAQLSFRESLRDIQCCLRAVPARLYHMGIRGGVSKSTLADANERRDWRIFADFAQQLIPLARALHCDEELGLDLNEHAYALDSTTIDLCLSLCPWSTFRRGRGGVKVHALLDLRGNIPSFVCITSALTYDATILDQIIFEPGAFYVLDRGYLDYERLFRLHCSGAFFVTRAQKSTSFRRLSSAQIDPATGVLSDQRIRLDGVKTRHRYSQTLRRVRFLDPDQNRKLVFLTNAFQLPSATIAQLYKMRWQIELFFKWIKQHLRIKTFFGTSENAVRTQIWIALTVYLLVAIARKRLDIGHSLHTFLQVLSVNLFDKTPIKQLFSQLPIQDSDVRLPIQLNLLDL